MDTESWNIWMDGRYLSPHTCKRCIIFKQFDGGAWKRKNVKNFSIATVVTLYRVPKGSPPTKPKVKNFKSLGFLNFKAQNFSKIRILQVTDLIIE